MRFMPNAALDEHAKGEVSYDERRNQKNYVETVVEKHSEESGI